MATTTPNFGWPVPTSTDLVKDGATAIEGLGDAIDASLLDLKGGTSGQVLKKNSNTDMDFIWSADSAGMTNPMTTTGDTIYSSSGSTPARLGIGSTGQVLTVAGGVPSWATPTSSSGPAFSAKRATSNQTFSSATWTKAEYNSEFFDLDSCYDSTTNYRFTPTKAGIYSVSFISEIASTTSGDIFTAIYKNGANYATVTGLKSSTFLLASGASSISMNGTTDYLEIYVYAAGSSPKIDLGTAQFSASFIRSN